MPTGAIPWFCPRDSQRPVDVLDVRSMRRGRLVSRPEHWEWLHELRNRFELAIEVLDFDLQHVLSAVTHVPSAAALRLALQDDGEGTPRDAAAAALRSGRPQSITTGGLRIRLVP